MYFLPDFLISLNESQTNALHGHRPSKFTSHMRRTQAEEAGLTIHGGSTFVSVCIKIFITNNRAKKTVWLVLI